jgi:hypothetical protein
VMTGLGGADGRRQPSPAAADNCDLHRIHIRPRACTFQANQSLRAGVSLMR